MIVNLKVLHTVFVYNHTLSSRYRLLLQEQTTKKESCYNSRVRVALKNESWKICAAHTKAILRNTRELRVRRTLISNVATLLARRVISGAAASGLTTEHRHRPRNNTALEQPPRLSRPGRSSFPCCYIIHAAVRLHG